MSTDATTASSIDGDLSRLPTKAVKPRVVAVNQKLSWRITSRSSLIGSNENKISDGYRERASIRSGGVLVIGKRDRAAGSRSLHRPVRCLRVIWSFDGITC